MSYILDALRRAQAERDRGQVPGLHAQPLSAPAPTVAGRPSLWLGLAAVAALVLLALLVALLLRAPSAEQAAPAAPAQPPVLPPVQPAPATRPAAPARTPLPVVVSAPPAVRSPPPGLSAGPKAAPAAASPPALPMSSLSAEQRRDLPALVISGSVWSASAASRFVVINGQIVHEGEAAAPGVTLERIGPRSALMRWRGLRIEVPF